MIVHLTGDVKTADHTDLGHVAVHVPYACQASTTDAFTQTDHAGLIDNRRETFTSCLTLFAGLARIPFISLSSCLASSSSSSSPES